MALHRLIAAAALGLWAALGLYAAAGAARAQEAGAVSPPAITVMVAETAMLTDRAYVSGLIAPVERVEVQPEIEGQAVTEIDAEVGDRVEAGQVLARLSDTALSLQLGQATANKASAEAGIAQARAQLSEAETMRDDAVRNRDRTVTLAAQGSVTQTSADDAVANAAGAEARLNAATEALNAAQAQLRLVEAQTADVELQLRRTAIVAPVTGEILERNAMIGAIAGSANEPLFAILRDGLLELRADVAELDVLRLAAGQRVMMRVVGLPEPLGGAIRLVEPTVDTVSRLGRVRIAIDRPEAVRSGMFAAAEVIVQTRKSIAVPVSAIGGGAEGATVLRFEDGAVSQVAVAVGIRDGDSVEIVGGLAPGDMVVAKAGAFVRDGDRINPVLPELSARTAMN